MHPSLRILSAVFVASAAIGCNNDGDDSAEGSGSSTGTGTGAPASTGETTDDAPTTGEPTPTTTDDTTDGTTGGEPLTRVEMILAGLGVAMYECPNRVWPDVEDNYRSRQVVLASQAENTAWVWNYQDGEGEPPVITKGPLDSLDPEWTSTFNFSFLGTARTLGISLDYTQMINEESLKKGEVIWPDYGSVLSYHEGFHYLSDQDDWSVGAGSRSSPYPEPWEPRYLRAQLKRALKGELEGEPDALAAASFWQGRLQTEFMPEMNAIRSYDCTEGSAEYASLMMSALAELGCAADDAELLALATSHLEDGVFVDLDSFSVGREPYDLGVLAGLLLRRDGEQGWELAVEKGQPPVAQLLAGVEPAAQPDDAGLQADVQAAIQDRNDVLAAGIEPLLANMKDPTYTRVLVSQGWIEGSFGLGGFYYLAEDPDLKDVWLNFSATLTPASAVVEVTGHTIFADVATPCVFKGSGTIVLVVPTADITLAGGSASIGNATVAFDGLAVEATMDAEMLPWLCPVDAGGANGAPAPEPELGLHTLRGAPHGQPNGQQRAVLRPRGLAP